MPVHLFLCLTVSIQAAHWFAIAIFMQNSLHKCHWYVISCELCGVRLWQCCLHKGVVMCSVVIMSRVVTVTVVHFQPHLLTFSAAVGTFWANVIIIIMIIIIMMIIITMTCLWCCHHDSESLREFTRFTRWMRNSARWLPTFGPSQQTWAIGPPVGSYSPFIIITQLILPSHRG